MKRLVSNGLLLLVVLMISLSFLSVGSQIVCANEEEATIMVYTPEEKAAAVKAADDSILRILLIERFMLSADLQDFLADVIRSRILLDAAKEKYGAVDEDFLYLNKLIEAELKAEKFLAIKAARDAIDVISLYAEYTDEYREAVKEARRLVDIAMNEYGATYVDICWRYDKLLIAEKKVEDEEPEPEPEPEPKPEPVKPKPRPTPPTGGALLWVSTGFALCAAGSVFIKCGKHRRRGKH